jgi:hypothetical protein
MDYRAAARHLAGELSSDMSMDPTMQDAHDPASTVPHGTDPVHDDGGDPASPGGPSPYNGVAPFGEPVADDPMWHDPSERDDEDGKPIPHVEGPDEDKTTLHNARLASYGAKAARYGR